MSNSIQAYRSLLSHLYEDDTSGMIKRPVAGIGYGLEYAVDRDSHRHLILPIDDDYAFAPVLGESLNLGELHYEGVRYLDLCCVSDGHRDVFAALADDIIRRLSSDVPSAPAEIQSALEEWRRLLRPAKEMTPEARRGLFGELVVLGWLARRNPQFALDVWTGPSGDCHDFTTANGDLEVKASSKEGLTVDISSLRQLDVTDGHDLTLIRLGVVDTPDGQSIRDKVEELVGLGVSRWSLYTKIKEVGLNVRDNPDPGRYAIASEVSAWRITSDFPGLRYGDLPGEWRDAISKVKYTLDLVSAPGRLDDELEAVLDRVMSD
ncbi:PD-(D/E)XK motif protein [Acidipropionibacterium acidipropionici]|uniref:PD-(D/E)XK motif protein n=1 Tax=Acidipropionibacterium acidipropionici TaxID=1748 RepID=UPI00110BA766|nr:PD-(D/E)XK motif protein [Acidipropionibacterium acidipropionici]QCV94182.1 PD-(D/E)XK motif protein [Acidipropionibacterium acidipropionici]